MAKRLYILQTFLFKKKRHNPEFYNQGLSGPTEFRKSMSGTFDESSKRLHKISISNTLSKSTQDIKN